MEWLDLWQLLYLKTLMLGHGGSSAGSYLADPTSPIPSHCAVIILFQSGPSAAIVATSTVRVNMIFREQLWDISCIPLWHSKNKLICDICCEFDRLLWWLSHPSVAGSHELPQCQKATIHQVSTTLTTSKVVLFPGRNNLLTTGTDDPTLSPKRQRVKGHQYWLLEGDYDLEIGHF